MKYLHSMIRVADPKATLAFFCDGLGFKEVRRIESEQGRFTLIFLAAPEDTARCISEQAGLSVRLNG